MNSTPDPYENLSMAERQKLRAEKKAEHEVDYVKLLHETASTAIAKAVPGVVEFLGIAQGAADELTKENPNDPGYVEQRLTDHAYLQIGRPVREDIRESENSPYYGLDRAGIDTVSSIAAEKIVAVCMDKSKWQPSEGGVVKHEDIEKALLHGLFAQIEASRPKASDYDIRTGPGAGLG